MYNNDVATPRYALTSDSTLYHVYLRGVEKRAIFLSHADRTRFVNRLKKYAKEEHVTIWMHRLMKNHFHMVAQAESIDKLSAMLHRQLTSHAKFFNLKYDRVGHLFQNRYQCKAIDSNEYLSQLLSYLRLQEGSNRSRQAWFYVNPAIREVVNNL